MVNRLSAAERVRTFSYSGGPLDGETFRDVWHIGNYRAADGSWLAETVAWRRLGKWYRPGPEDIYVRHTGGLVYRWAPPLMAAQRRSMLAFRRVRLADEVAAGRPDAVRRTRLEIELLERAVHATAGAVP